MKLIKTTDSVGQILCHDITQIIRGIKKDAAFRKGHIITEEDIPVLLSLGTVSYTHLDVYKRQGKTRRHAQICDSELQTSSKICR